MKIINRSRSLDRRRNVKHLKKIYGIDKVEVASQIADFDYESPPFVNHALMNYLATNPSLSYRLPDPKFFENIIWWYKETKGITNLDKSMISYSWGVIFSLAVFIEFSTASTDKILVNAPAYPPFVKICEGCKRQVIIATLDLKPHSFDLNFEKLETLFATHHPKVFIFCNPLNPTGRLWTLKDLNTIAGLCQKYKTYLLVDEVHSDLTLSGSGFVSALKIDQKYQDYLMVISSPSKGFNLGSTNSSYVITPKAELTKLFREALRNLWLVTPNPFSQELIKAVYSQKGIKWIQEMANNHQKNYAYIEQYLQNHNLPLEALRLDSGFCVAIKFLNIDSKDELTKIKAAFLKAGLIVQFSDDFYDYQNYWFRIIISTDLKTIQKLMHGINKIFK